MRTPFRHLLIATAAVLLVPSAIGLAQSDSVGVVLEDRALADTAVARASCADGSLPEPGLQGDVPAADRDSGRSTQGYRCNINRIGGYAGRGAGITSTQFEHCAYLGTFFPGNLLGPARACRSSTSPIRRTRAHRHTDRTGDAGGYLGEPQGQQTAQSCWSAAGVPALTGAGLLSVYDICDCAHPRLLNPGTGHRSDPAAARSPPTKAASPRTAAPTGARVSRPACVSAVDLTDPADPRVIWQGCPAIPCTGSASARRRQPDVSGEQHGRDEDPRHQRGAAPRSRSAGAELADMTWIGWLGDTAHRPGDLRRRAPCVHRRRGRFRRCETDRRLRRHASARR